MIISFRISQENFSWFSSEEKINRKTAEEQVKSERKTANAIFCQTQISKSNFLPKW